MRNVTAMKIKYENYINIIHLRSVPGLTSLFSNLQLRIRVSSLDGGGGLSLHDLGYLLLPLGENIIFIMYMEISLN